MAAPASQQGVTEMDLILVFGVKKIPITLNITGDGQSDLTLEHLSQRILQETNIEPSCQKIIYKGRTLFKAEDIGTALMETGLSSLGLRNGEKLMVLGRKIPEKKDGATVSKVNESGPANPLVEISRFFDNLVARYDEQLETCAKVTETKDIKLCWKNVMTVHEEMMKLLERVDSTTAGQDENYRKQRKSLVNAIQTKLDQCENCLQNLSKRIKESES